MNKEEMIATLNELNRQIDFEDFDNNVRIKKINELEEEIPKVIEKISQIERKLNNDEYYENYAKKYRKNYEAMYENAKLLLIKKNDDIARINEIIDFLNKEHDKINSTKEQCSNEIDILKRKEELTPLEKSKLEIYIKRVDNLENALKNNEKMINNNNNLLNSSTNNIDELNETIQQQNEYLKNFDNYLKNEIIENEKEHDKKGLDISKRYADALKQYKSSIEINFKNKFNQIISDLKNNKISLDEVNYQIDYYKDRLFDEYIPKDEDKRKEELIKNISEQEECKKIINDLENKLSNKENYKLKDSTRSNMMNNAKKIERLSQQGKVLFYEGYRKDYEEITKMYEEDKENLLNELNDDINDNRRKEINIKIDELNNIISQGKELTNDYSKYKKLFDKISERAKSEEIDRSAIRLDENKLNEYNSIMNSLKNRHKFLESNIGVLLKKFEIPKNENNINENNLIEKESEQFEIISINRPLKEKIKKKMKKVAVAIITSMTLMLSASASLNISNNINDSINDITIENAINEKANANITEEEAIKKVEEELQNELLNNISINDQIIIKEGSNIYQNQNDAENKVNPFNPIKDLKEKKDIIGVSIKMPDGSFKFVQDDNNIKKLIDEGGTISACLTGEGNNPEGFWNINDISHINKIEQKIGGMSR